MSEELHELHDRRETLRQEIVELEATLTSPGWNTILHMYTTLEDNAVQEAKALTQTTLTLDGQSMVAQAMQRSMMAERFRLMPEHTLYALKEELAALLAEVRETDDAE